MATDKNKELARDIIERVGGEGNVDGLRHCITRLRFNLKDSSKADTDYLKKRDGIVTVVEASGQYQVVIGNEVSAVYEAITEVSNIGSATETTSISAADDDRSFLDKFIDTLTGLFQPLLGALTAAGIIKGLHSLLTVAGVDPTSGFMQIIAILGDGFFQFLPLALVVTSAQRFKMNTFTALAIGSVLLYPTLASLQSGDLLYTLFAGTPFASDIFNTFLGIPIILPPGGSYYSSVIPAIVAIWFSAKVEKWVKSWMPQIITGFFTPVMTILIAGTLSLLVIGPVATWGANLVGAFFSSIQTFSPILFHVILQAAWQILVIFGLHWGVLPLAFMEAANAATNYASPIFAAVAGSTFPVFGAILAIWWKSKEDKTRSIASGAALPALFGVTEPAIYGLMLPMKKVFGGVILANMIVGAYNGIFDIVQYGTGGLGIFAIPNYIDPTGANPMNVWHRIISFVLLTVLGFVFTLIVGIPNIQGEEEILVTAESDAQATNQVVAPVDSPAVDSPVANAEVVSSAHKDIIASPIKGEVVAIDQIPDPVFASGAMGKGVGIVPSEGVVYAPTNATVTMIFPTGHAIGLTTEAGTEILIHIGIDTVELDGRGFEALVAAEDKVEAGQELIRFEIDLIKEAGYAITTPVIVTNTNEFEDVLISDQVTIDQGDYLLTTLAKK